ncbi:YbhB/YbcL family Raf kinase inhibitor-like protein [Natronomonas sp. CBA1123]|jgi:Raf kinase inhibitor-like YbhB/YbcL family protein|uniref:YbhB/YbcL family Raf kinase inhibitor-like protein n=1 Tax=Natronomonas sp. CBA1123 TaxID=2668070 RepID=UPI0012EABDF5|nr:YbhB/YbcL family Raf kinase inhibitor-like protein [Natronomonas sp. CBA1123]MUV87542.1 YbhB/YbcL family Raf kinase inhibitor-like protein [Natronomonas sp. CBA1123]
MTELQLTSPVFADGDAIPRQYGYTETNVNPPLEITGVPDDAEALALVVDDPDAVEPAGKVWDHWVVYDIDPATTTIPEDWDGGNALDGTNDYGETGYGGPNPPDREHTYRFRLYALDAPVDLDAGASKAELETAMDGHILADATLEGTYAP